MNRKSIIVLSVAFVLALSVAASALAGRNLAVGVNEDAVKSREGISSVANALGLGYYRVTQAWHPGQTKPSPSDTASLDATVRNAGSQKILLNVFGSASAAPNTASERAAYCSFVSTVLDRYPQIRAVNVWNEANLSYFWKPQFNRNGSSAAPADYEALLARCYDTIKSGHMSVRVFTSISPRGNDNPRARSNSPILRETSSRSWGRHTAARTAGRGSLTTGDRTSTARARRSAPGCATAGTSARATTRGCSPT